jgi:hypothetical protein
VSSIAGFRGAVGGGAAYTASKHAVSGLTKNTAYIYATKAYGAMLFVLVLLKLVGPLLSLIFIIICYFFFWPLPFSSSTLSSLPSGIFKVFNAYYY